MLDRLLPNRSSDLAGRRVLITGAARGIGALTARRLHERGARLALLGLEPDLLGQVAAECDATAYDCDVADPTAVENAVEKAVEKLGGLDVAIANAGIAAQLPLIGGDRSVFERTLAVNVLGTYYVVRAAGPHLAHEGGYMLITSSLAAAVHLPLMGAYSASKAAVEALGNTLRAELAPTGARVGVAYYAELDTDMTSRGFGTEAAKRLTGGPVKLHRVAPVGPAIDAIEHGIATRARRIVAPRYVAPVIPFRALAQPVVDRALRGRVAAGLELARSERVELTTPQPTDA
ncbi:MAG TPA: SDR family NAD(P)-dependent oxidoreductase [Acidimicrobiales bacterium]|jgi:NAD(P)-dependent dehydrogenase (short-subunit alcohol dehydrogenase family)|nr:SDR family NAD(P)-dependent oxidoreductase [Acidimicrobiales bacterium]